MKGRKLTLEEVLNLEDGSVVWVEDNRKNFDNGRCVYSSIYNNLNSMRHIGTYYDLDNIRAYDNKLKFYEWIEDNLYANPMMIFDEDDDLVHKMSVEICNLRGLDLTDDNIRLIVEEFS